MPPDLPREFELLCACCGWPLSPPRLDDIRAKAAGTADWELFLGLVRRHRVAGLVHNALRQAATTPPLPIAEALTARARRIARQNLTEIGESALLRRALEGAGIPVRFLKGGTLAQLAYGTPALKESVDIDLLIPADRAEEALQVLQSEGYSLQFPAERLRDAQRRAVIRYGKEFGLVRPDRRVRVELHWHLADNPFLLRDVDIASPAQEVTVAPGCKLPTLAEEDLFAYLCVHGAVHGWSRLKWLADLNAFLSARTADDVERLHRHAASKGAGRCAGQALLLCRDLLAMELPAGIERELEQNPRLDRLTAVAMKALVSRDPTAELEHRSMDKMRVLLAAFRLGRGRRFLLAQMRHAAVGYGDILALPLPEPLHLLYPVLRPFLWPLRRWRYFAGRASWHDI